MIMKDGQDHHRLRILGNHAFTPSALERWQSVIERVVDELLDTAIPRGRIDLIEDLTKPLPAIVIAELFGIPPEDREVFHEWSMAVARFFGGAVGDREEAAQPPTRPRSTRSTTSATCSKNGAAGRATT